MKAYIYSPSGAEEFSPFYKAPYEDAPYEYNRRDVRSDMLTKAALSGKFIWITHKGEAKLLNEMATPHIFYSLRMVFNHSVPPCFRVGELRRYYDVSNWQDARKAAAITALRQELSTRYADELDSEQIAQLQDMEQNTRVILALGL